MKTRSRWVLLLLSARLPRLRNGVNWTTAGKCFQSGRPQFQYPGIPASKEVPVSLVVVNRRLHKLTPSQGYLKSSFTRATVWRGLHPTLRDAVQPKAISSRRAAPSPLVPQDQRAIGYRLLKRRTRKMFTKGWFWAILFGIIIGGLITFFITLADTVRFP